MSNLPMDQPTVKVMAMAGKSSVSSSKSHEPIQNPTI